MGRNLVKKIQRENAQAKVGLILVFTFLTCVFMYEGLLKPLIGDSATNTYYFTLDGTSQNVGADGYTDTYTSRNGKISMAAGTYNSSRNVAAAPHTNWQPMMNVYGPLYGSAQSLTSPAITIGVRDAHGTSSPIYWKADVYDYNPAGTSGNGVLLWSSTGTDEAHSYTPAALNLSFGVSTLKNIPANHRLKVIISCRMTSTNSDARLYWGSSTNYSFMTVTEAAAAANIATVTNLADYNGGGLASVLAGEQNVAMLKFDIYANATTNWTGGKLDKIGNNPNLGDVTYNIYKDSNGNGQFDAGSDTMIGGPYSFSQATGAAYTLTAAQALSVTPQRHFVIFNISGSAATATTVGARISGNDYFTLSNGITATNVSPVSSSMPAINGIGTPVSKTYAADWDTGTTLLLPETGGPSSTNSVCLTSSVLEPASTNLVGLLNFPAHTCTSVSGIYHFSSEANPKFVTLYFNGPSGYSTQMTQVKGISFKFRARSDYSTGTFTFTLFYDKPDGTRVSSTVASKYSRINAKTVTVSLAGQTLKNVPAGSRIGLQIGVSKANCGIGLGKAVGSQLVVEETSAASTGVDIGDGAAIANASVLASSTNNLVNSFSLVSPSGNQTVTSVTITGGPMTTSSNVAAVKLFADSGTFGTLDSADTLLGTGTFTGNTATISGLSEVTSGTMKRYLVAYDITADPATSIILTGLVSNLGGVTVDSNSDSTSGTLTILPTTSITNGIAEPANQVVPSGGAAVYLDAFGVKSNGGSSDTINTITVGLAPAGISAKIARVEIVDRNSGNVYGHLGAPTSGDEWRINTTGLAATTTTTECYLRITPKANITAVHNVTGQVMTITHLKSQYGVSIADSSSATITLDGQAPSDPVLAATGGSAGGIQLSWTAASDLSGLHPTKAYTLVRGLVNAPPPANCSSGVVVYQGTALSATENSLTPGQTYAYRVCATDVVNNTSKGTAASAVATVPTVCNNAPTIMATPSSLFIKSGGQASYKVAITNNDTGSCPDTTFTVSLVGTENSTDFVTPSAFTPAIVTLRPNGGGAAATLTMTARASAPNGAVNSLKFRVTASGHPSMETSTLTSATVNNNASMLHTSLNLGNQKYGEWGTNYTCATCHSRPTTNIKRVATTIVTPTGSRSVAFLSTSASTSVTTGVMGNDRRAVANSTNVCEVCHHNTRFHQYSGSKVAWQDHNNSSDCIRCHPHNKGFRYIGGGQCDDCHGNPPTTFNTMASPATNALGLFAATAGVHATHQIHMTCTACHSNANHNSSSVPAGNNLVEMGFNINNNTFPGFVGSVTTGSFTGNDPLNTGYMWSTAPGTSLIKATATTSCNVYCHGWSGSGGADPNPLWTGTGQSACGTCHGASGPNPPLSGSHIKHAGTDIGNNGIACAKCHGSINSSHINGNVEWDLSSISANASYKWMRTGSTGALAPTDSASYGNCANLYCHSNVQSANGTAGPSHYAAPRWGDKTTCGDCHDNMAISATPSGGHRQHAEDPATQFDCRICHATGGDANPQNHANGRIDFNFNGTAAYTVYSKGTSKIPGSGGYGTCSNSNCHGRQTLAWGPESALPLCDKCHGSATTVSFYDTRGPGSATGKSEPFVGSHDQHIKAAPYSYARTMDCSECHVKPGGPYSPGHIDSQLPAEVSFGPIASAGSFYGYTTLPTYNYATRQCNNFWCHGGGMDSNTGKGYYASVVADGGTLGSPVVPKWNDTLLNGNQGNDCNKCHGCPPPAPDSGYAHYGLSATSCNGCHNHVAADGKSFTDPSKHVNGIIDGCNTCHGRPPTSLSGITVPPLNAMSPGSVGAHNAHQLNPSIGDNCAVCHNNYTMQMPSYAMEMGFNAYGGKVTSGVFYGYSTLANNVYVSSSPGTIVRRTNDTALRNKCTNVYCHGGGTATKPVLGGGTNIEPNWELGYDEVNCGACHGVTAATYATSGSHGRHAGAGSGGLALACEKCHGVKENNYHVNGNVEWHFNSTDVRIGSSAVYRNMTSGGTGALAPSSSFGSCSNLYCHSNAQGTGGSGAPSSYGAPQWGTTTPLGCGGCHRNMASDASATGSHKSHANSYACSTCHNGSGSGTAKHADHVIDLAFNGTAAGVIYTAGSHQAGSGPYGICSNATCHGGLQPAWGSTISGTGCAKCHGDTTATATFKATDGTSNGTLSKIHVSHINATHNMAAKITCADCHTVPAVNGTVGHFDTALPAEAPMNGTLARTGGLTPNFNAATHSCTNVYCHGKSLSSNATPPSGVQIAPTWTATLLTGTVSNDCGKCHGYPPTTGTTHNGVGTNCIDCHTHVNSSGTAFTDPTKHINGTVEGGDCLSCHVKSQGNRVAVVGQFASSSHHVQGVTLTNVHCYQCHWEADSNGNTTSYHQKTSGAAIDLVIYGSGIRPTAYTAGTTAVQYTANGTRAQLLNINQHCLGCHSDKNNTTTPFGDGKTPKQYAWDSSSIASRYGDTGVTPWGKYNGTNVTPKSGTNKAYSAHGNATANHGGWNTSETWPDTRNGTQNVVCFDCHNSHGSSVAGTTTSYLSFNNTYTGGILKDTEANKGGYSVTYKPVSGGAAANHNLFNAGAALCFDCHLTANTSGTTKPWGYTSTYGATQKIAGYFDTDYFGLGTFGYQSRSSYKSNANMGGHFGASSALSMSASKPINGLCTPCHDPHGVSQTLGTNKTYAVPLLRGTWLTSPYKEDIATADNAAYKGAKKQQGPRPTASYDAAIASYRIDENTFTSGTITQTDTQFAGLCLNCHPKASLTNGTTHTWKDKNRVHESVKGWKTTPGKAVKHNYSCSKCHAVHNANLPRLMITNCLNYKHRGRVANNTSPIISGSNSVKEGSGSGKMPGSYTTKPGEEGGAAKTKTLSCHEGNDTTQKWNNKTQW